jgi:hypothetical protein
VAQTGRLIDLMSAKRKRDSAQPEAKSAAIKKSVRFAIFCSVAARL